MNRFIRLGAWQNARQLETLSVIDVSADGALVGIEVLQASSVFGNAPPIAANGVLEIRLDPIADAIYIRLDGSASVRQDVCDVVFFLDQANVLVGIEFDWRPNDTGT
jgi:uncharacterized protein YuzE